METSSDESLNREIAAAKTGAVGSSAGGDAYSYWQQRLAGKADSEESNEDDYIDSDEESEKEEAVIQNPFKEAAVTKTGDAVSSDEDYELSQTLGKNKFD